ncbi:MAG TPA: ABC transporter substrate-binding protein, partial [Bacteroidales bacterium]|nr:ABC transporter substrate-binding protein [Bacteroidales bacterium]
MGEFNVISNGTINSGYHLMNCADRYFQNEKIRKAFSSALDRDDYVSVVTNDTQYPGWWYVPNNLGIGSENFSNKVGNPNYAKKLFDDVRTEFGSPKELLIAGLQELGEDIDPSKMDVTMQFRGTSETEKQRGEYYQ